MDAILHTPPHRSRPAQAVIASISKGHCSELRISLGTWRGNHKIEIREATATIPNVYMPTPNGVTLDVDRLHELITALQRAEAEAITRGMLPNGRAAA